MASRADQKKRRAEAAAQAAVKGQTDVAAAAEVPPVFEEQPRHGELPEGATKVEHLPADPEADGKPTLIDLPSVTAQANDDSDNKADGGIPNDLPEAIPSTATVVVDATPVLDDKQATVAYAPALPPEPVVIKWPPSDADIEAARREEQARIAAQEIEKAKEAIGDRDPPVELDEWLGVRKNRDVATDGLPPAPEPLHIDVEPAADEDDGLPRKPPRKSFAGVLQGNLLAWIVVLLSVAAVGTGFILYFNAKKYPAKKDQVTATAPKPPVVKKREQRVVEPPAVEKPKEAVKAEALKPVSPPPKAVAKEEGLKKPSAPSAAPVIVVEKTPSPATSAPTVPLPTAVIEDKEPSAVATPEPIVPKPKVKKQSPQKKPKAAVAAKATVKAKAPKLAKPPKAIAKKEEPRPAPEPEATPAPPTAPTAKAAPKKKVARVTPRDHWGDDLPTRSVYDEDGAGDDIERQAYEAA
ncbi:MAG: hypothetical protein A2848_00630, partial [Candidatus Magasanikbacteria bacterium RIFCSPHIGHO2_01_FULL_50_8]